MLPSLAKALVMNVSDFINFEIWGPIIIFKIIITENVLDICAPFEFALAPWEGMKI